MAVNNKRKGFEMSLRLNQRPDGSSTIRARNKKLYISTSLVGAVLVFKKKKDVRGEVKNIQLPETLVNLCWKLLSLGGKSICIFGVSKNYAEEQKLIDQGSVIDSEVLFSKGEPNNCHENATRLTDKYPNITHYLGYGLSDDGMWRMHSWGVLDTGEIIETTVARDVYYGIAA
jgi:hypothetical protein